MGERAHTKGPWFICGEPGHEPQSDSWREGLTIGSAPEGTRICDLTSLRVDWQNAANARLIAAAPDMFEALKTFVAEYVDLVESGDAGFWDPEKETKVIAARAAIAKAEGRANLADANTNPAPAPTPSDRREGL